VQSGVVTGLQRAEFSEYFFFLHKPGSQAIQSSCFPLLACITSRPLMSMQEKENKGKISWLKRLGWAGFFFFLIKGCFWLAFALFGGQALFESCN